MFLSEKIDEVVIFLNFLAVDIRQVLFQITNILGHEFEMMEQLESTNGLHMEKQVLRDQQLVQGSCVGLYFINRTEWLIVDHACSAYSFIWVPLYDTLGPNAVKYILNHASIHAVFGVPQTLDTLLKFLSEIPSVRLIVVVGGVDNQIPTLPSTTGLEVISYSKLLSQELASLQPFCPPKPDDIATIMYTSGTTGTPKGVVLTHANLIVNVAGATYGIIVSFRSDHLKLLEDMTVLKPTIFCSVPRLYNKLYAGFTLNISGKKSSPMWDRLVFNKIKATLGGRVRYMVSGASPLSPEVMDFLRVCFGCQAVEGHGMTQTSCVISNMDEHDFLSGHIGAPNPACEIKLVDVPEMNYTTDDQPYPRGEICIRGPQLYFKATIKIIRREAIDEDGWLHTGDIGLWKKNIFKLAQGEYKAPEKIENVYATSKFIAQNFVYGDSLNSSLVAVVSVEQEMLKVWAAAQGIKYEDLQQLCTNQRVRAAVLADVDDVGRAAQSEFSMQLERSYGRVLVEQT
ncbi:hypothetical protein ACH5RR_033301, partial [Cinchona calisaya]